MEIIADIEPAGLFIITILYNSARSLPGFIRDLQAQDSHSWTLVVIDNASMDDGIRIFSEFNDQRFVLLSNETNVGFSAAVNQGIRHAFSLGAKSVLLMNNDISFDRFFLRDLQAAWTKTGAPVVAPRVMDRDDPGHSWYAGGHLDRSWVFTNVHDAFDPMDDREPRQVDFATGCCLGLTRSAIEQAGLFDESFFVYWEDVDFSMRLNKAKIPIFYLPDPVLFHAGAEATGGARTIAHSRLYYRSYMKVVRKHFGLLETIKTMLRLTLLEIKRFKGEWKLLLCVIQAMLAGLVSPLKPLPTLEHHRTPQA